MANQRRIRFGVFQLDTQTRELTRDGVPVRLQDQPYQVLLALIENAGELVTREELAKRLWPQDTYVDFDVGLSRAVNKLRDALGDAADNPRFIQTLARRGYRFIAPAEIADPAPPGMEAVIPPRARSRWWFAALAIFPLAGAVGWSLWQRGDAPAPRIGVLTSFSGLEGAPSFSPDGSQVAFTWSGPKVDNADIYVKLVGTENTLRLTSDPSADVAPAWSPDGKRIAFIRADASRALAVFLISPLGGSAQKLADLPRTAEAALSWSPDGKWLAFADGQKGSASVYLLPVAGGEPRRITRPVEPASDHVPVFSPDGTRLAYSGCRRRYSCDIYVLELDAAYAARGPARRVTSQDLFIAGMAWGGDSLVYSGSLCWGMLHYLWRAKADGTGTPERLDIAGPNAYSPAVSPGTHRLAFSRGSLDYDIWRFQVHGSLEPLIRSSLSDLNPQYSPDGTRIAFSTSRSGDAFNIWVANADGSNPAPLVQNLGRSEGSPNWSPDGRSIAFDSLQPDGSAEIFVVDAAGGRPRSLAAGHFLNGMPTWSRDGKWIYFFSDRTGRQEIWKVPSQGGRAEQVTRNGGFLAFESVDGKTLYYTKAGGITPLFARPVNGGEERQVVDSVGYARDFVVVEDGIYYSRRPQNGRTPVLFHHFSNGVSRLITTVDGVVYNGLTVSPDRKSILIARSDVPGADLMLIENFR